MIGGKEADHFISSFLDESQAVVLIDGLDELGDDIARDVIKDVNSLAITLSRSKIILTCRSGYYEAIRMVEGFDVLEILPLEQHQIKLLSSLWLDDPRKFERALKSVPYSDLTDRPLLLSQLIVIFIRYGSLPQQPKEVYQFIIELLLREWDADRSIVRHSKYADFSPKRKSEFLAELSFLLMYGDDKLQFDNSDLIRIYKEIHLKYGLPKNEAKQVAEEVETHTGILVISGYKKYEFSHLSLHEYLCADYIVRSPMTPKIRELLSKHPEPVAIAVSLASDSSEWFNSLVLDNTIFDVLKGNMGPFIRRLVLERPHFGANEVLGFCIFNVFYSSYIGADDDIKPTFESFFSLPGIQKSVQILLTSRKHVMINRKKPRSRELIVSYKLDENFITGNRFSKQFSTSTKDITEFFSAFGVVFKSNYIN